MKYDAVSEKLNDVWMNGFQEEEYGSCQEEGFSRALIITDEIVGIIQEDDQGFIDYITFAITGNATDFGNLTTVRSGIGGTSDGSRGVFGGGDEPPNNRVNKIDYITIATTGNATTFGTLTVGRSHPSATSNGARGIFAGGHTGSEYTDTIDYITIATTGNAIDFGNLSASQSADIVACSGD